MVEVLSEGRRDAVCKARGGICWLLALRVVRRWELVLAREVQCAASARAAAGDRYRPRGTRGPRSPANGRAAGSASLPCFLPFLRIFFAFVFFFLDMH